MAKKVSINASAKAGANIAPIEAGSYGARCYAMAHIGTVPDTFQGKKITVNRVRIFFELPEELAEFDGEMKPRHISKEYTLSLSSKANLKKDLEAWRGKQFTEEELDSFDITNVVGAECMLSIVNKKSETTGNIYANIASVSKPVKGMKVGKLHEDTEQVIFAYSLDEDDLIKAFLLLPEFVQDAIVTSAEWKELKIERPKKDEKESPAAAGPADEVSEASATEDEDKPPF